jgi:hypothetical protein
LYDVYFLFNSKTSIHQAEENAFGQMKIHQENAFGQMPTLL